MSRSGKNPHPASTKVGEELDPAKRMMVVDLSEEESALLRNVVRSTPDQLLAQIIKVIPVSLLILAVDEAPVRGTRKTIPEIQRRLDVLQEKLAARLKT